MSPLGERLLTADEVAAFLSVKRKRVYELAALSPEKGGLPCVRVLGQLRFKPETVREFIDRQLARGVATAGAPADQEPEAVITAPATGQRGRPRTRRRVRAGL